MTARASAISRLMNSINVPGWAYQTRQMKTGAVLTVDDHISKDAALKREIEELLVFAGYEFHLNGTRFYIISDGDA
jgi:hypothetical protein